MAVPRAAITGAPRAGTARSGGTVPGAATGRLAGLGMERQTSYGNPTYRKREDRAGTMPGRGGGSWGSTGRQREGVEVPSEPSLGGPSLLSPAEHTAQKVGFLQALTHHKPLVLPEEVMDSCSCIDPKPCSPHFYISDFDIFSFCLNPGAIPASFSAFGGR